jgi:tetratricopeptide (TPR) repeat protein
MEQPIIEDKIKLIYEFNHNSSLFARVALSEVEHGSIHDAINMLLNGIKLFPTYSSPYIVLALANAYSGNENEALKYLSKGCEIINSPETFKYYKEKISGIITDRNSLSESLRPEFLETPVEDSKENKIESTPENDVDIVEKLDILAEQLSKAKIKPKPDEHSDETPGIPEFTGKKIATETLAEIFVNQKNYSEAISIYEELILQKPEKTVTYLEKISEIRQFE